MAMRIRVASTLTALVLIAFALELIAVLSVPVTQTITLCEYGDYKFGVFGYCNTKTGHCSDVGVGYDVSNIDNKFSLPSNARNSLANLLIVHVVAAGLTLILLIFSILAHIHGPANSSRFILFVLVFSIPSFLLTLLAFLVDILLFVSHLSWGGWIMLAATVLLLAALIVLCIMRRTLSSQKAMRKRLNVTSELHDMNDFGSQQPHGGDPFTGVSSSRSNKDPDFTELKYETNTSDEVPLNNDNQVGPNRHQSFILHDEPSEYQQSNTFTDHYQHATHNAYRGVANTATTATSSESAATATTNLPTTGQHPQVPQIPAGMNIDDYDEEGNVNSGGEHNYGPNVVPIPMLRDDAAARRAHQRKPSGPRAYRPQAQYQHPPQPQYPQQHNAQYEQPQRATYYEQEQHQPYGPETEQEQQQQQQQYEIDPEYDSRGQQPESSETAAAAAAASSYVPPRQQWQQHPQQQYSSRRGDGYDYYDAESYPSASPPPPTQSPSAYSEGSYYQPPPPPSTQQQYYQPPRQPNRSDMVLESNPDFQIPPPSRANRQRRQKPPAASNAEQPPSSQGGSSQPSRPPPGRRKHPNMPAAFATSDSPYGISRAAGGGSLPPSI
jgi:uncharacterized membrane protein